MKTLQCKRVFHSSTYVSADAQKVFLNVMEHDEVNTPLAGNDSLVLQPSSVTVAICGKLVVWFAYMEGVK